MRRHTVIPDLPSGAALSPCRGAWSVIVAAAATNLITNPSGEIATTGYSSVTGAITRSADRQRHGVYGLKVVMGANDSDIGYSIGLAAATTYTFSLDVWAVAGVSFILRVFDVTANDYLPDVLEFRGTGGWERRRLSFVTSVNSSFVLCCGQNGGSLTPDFYTDGWQCCQLPYDTTYCDGDQPGCSWAGERHASLSRRSAQSRRGGRMVSLDDVGFQVTGEIGLGLQPAEDITTPTGLLGGALYQRTVQRVRTFSLIGVFLAASLGGLQRVQAELQSALTPFGLAEQQSLALRYRARDARGEPMGEEMELLCHYTGGLEGVTDNLYGERCALQFAQYLPLITSAGESAVALGTTESITDADYIVERQVSGVWHALNGGLSGFVNAAVYGPDGNLYVGGSFVTAYNAAGTGSPVTVNHIAKWDGTAWSALGGGLNNNVYALAFDATGLLYIGGVFTDAANPYLATWDGSALQPVALAADATGFVYALVVDGGGRVYASGEFLNWAAIADADNIVFWDGSAWQALGTGANDGVYALAVRPGSTDRIVAGGDFTTIGGVSADRVAQYDAQLDEWIALGTGFNIGVHALAYDATGALFAGGGFTNTPTSYIARQLGDWGSTFVWASVGTGVDYLVWALALDQVSHAMVVGGVFTSAGGLTLSDRIAQWTGTAWLPIAIDLPGTTTVRAITSHPDGRLAIGYQDAGTATAAIGDTTVTNAGTAPTAPIFTITGPGVLESIVNWTSGKALYFDLTVLDGETVTIDLTPGAISVLSTFRGNLGGSVLSGSDLASWRLLPGDNTIVVKAATAPVLMRYRPAYLSLQGATP